MFDMYSLEQLASELLADRYQTAREHALLREALAGRETHRFAGSRSRNIRPVHWLGTHLATAGTFLAEWSCPSCPNPTPRVPA